MDQEMLTKAAGDYQENGYVLLENFLSQEEVDEMKKEIERLIREESVKEEHAKEAKINHLCGKSDYYEGSVDKIRFIHEFGALKSDEQGNLEFCVPWEQSVAFVGNGLHIASPLFNNISTSGKVKQLFRELKYQAPTIMQSIVIMKNAKVGGQIPAHQDSASLLSEPDSVIGFWFALDDATPENGCMHFLPGSQKCPPTAKLMRTLDANGECQLTCVGTPTQWDESKFVPVPAKAGTLIVFHGRMVHRSNPNLSDKPRCAYSMHAYDKKTSVWPDTNKWLPPKDNPGAFITLYEEGSL